MVVVGLTTRLFLWPPTGYPDRADAVVVLSGDHGERLPRALALIEDGVASTLVHAGDPDSPAARALCQAGASFEVICLRLDPDSTRHEARAVGDLARARRWRSLIVVTSTQHAVRAGVLFRRCVDGSVGLAHARPHYGNRTLIGQIGTEWLALGYAVGVDRAC